jgi:hypothetical protein
MSEVGGVARRRMAVHRISRRHRLALILAVALSATACGQPPTEVAGTSSTTTSAAPFPNRSATTTAMPSTTAPAFIPTIAVGLWLEGEEIAVLEMSGSAWDHVVAEAGDFDASMTDYGWQDSTDGSYALAAALVYARTGDLTLRTKVADAIRTIATNPYDIDNNPSALGWARTMTAWIVAADLINLADYRPDTETSWHAFLADMPTHPYPGDGGDSLLALAISRANNIGAFARTAVTAIAIYTNDDPLLDHMADLYRAWVEGSTEHRFDWTKTGKDRSWHCNPDDPMTYRGINAADCTRDGHDLSGVIADDYRRSGPYDSTDFPGPNATKYPWETLGAAITQAQLLHRAGYPNALTWGDNAPQRALHQLHTLHQTAQTQGWTFGVEDHEGSDDRWIIQLINHLYKTTYPQPTETNHGRPLTWTDWTHPTP